MKAFNRLLFQCLPSLLNLDYTGISAQLTVSRDTVARAMNSGDCRIEVFAELCNAFRLDYTAFFIEEDATYMPTDIIVPKRYWVTLSINAEEFASKGYVLRYTKMSQVASLMSTYPDIVWFSGGRKGKDYATQEAAERDLVAEESNTEKEKNLLAKPGKWVYNSRLYELLPRILGVGKTNLFIEAGRSGSTFERILDAGDIRITILAELCNRWRLKISNFFVDGIPDQLQVPEREFTPYTFHGNYIETIPDVSNPGKTLTLDSIRSITNMHKQSMIRFRRKEGSSATANTLVAICNALDLDPMFFFDSEEQVSSRRYDYITQHTIERLEDKVESLTRDKQSLESRNRHLQELVDWGK